jgi:hypothetical protein
MKIILESQINKMSTTTDAETQTTDISIDYFEKAEKYIGSLQDVSTNNSAIMDVIAVYIKGQRILYTEAKTLCEQRLTSLMIPSILFTVICSISSLLLKEYYYGNYITSGLNGTIAFILALINYLKLDARAEAHRSSAYKYDKLMSYIHFQSGKLLFLTEESQFFGEIIKKIEQDVTEIKETNQFVLPEAIRFSFPVLSGINIFAIVKEILAKEIQYTIDLSINMKRIDEIIAKMDKIENAEDKIKYIAMLEIYEKSKQDLTNLIIDMQTRYTTIDHTFEREMAKYRKRSRWSIGLLELFKV